MQRTWCFDDQGFLILLPGHLGMGLLNRIKNESGEDMSRILPDTNEDITIHGCAVYFDVLRLCQCK